MKQEPSSTEDKKSILPEAEMEFEYYAFVSYSHQDNVDKRLTDPVDTARRARWADWLHNALETYRVPRAFAGKTNARGRKIPSQLTPCFQDQKELPTEARLRTAIEDALSRSLFLIVICSPRSACSIYVNAEVIFFKNWDARTASSRLSWQASQMPH